MSIALFRHQKRPHPQHTHMPQTHHTHSLFSYYNVFHLRLKRGELKQHKLEGKKKGGRLARACSVIRVNLQVKLFFFSSPLFSRAQDSRVKPHIAELCAAGAWNFTESYTAACADVRKSCTHTHTHTQSGCLKEARYAHSRVHRFTLGYYEAYMF